MSSEFKYFAFISYNSKDQAWGKRLQQKLEHYRLPSTLCSEHGWKRTPIKPVFFAPTDIQPGGLSEELQQRLQASQHLIVICSPNSAQSKWVGREIEFFYRLGREKNIHFFIVEGTPNSGDPATECFNPIVEQLGLPEILGANIHEKIYRQPWLNRERAYVQLISKLLGVEFDTLWQRQKRHLVRRTVAWIAGAIALVAILITVWLSSQPFDIEIRLNEASFHNSQLPPLRDAVATMTLDNETKTDTIRTIDDCLVFSNIPHRYLNKPVNFTLSCHDCLDTDTTVTLGKSVTLNLRRDPTVYGDIRFSLYNLETESMLSNTTIQIESWEVQSDQNGCVRLFVPLESQRRAYHITSTFKLLSDTIYTPCGENDVVLTN